MKKTIGIILTVVGYLAFGFSIASIVGAEFLQANNARADEIGQTRAIGIGLLILSLALFIIGVFMTASKSKKQKEMELELSNLRYAKENQ